MPELHALPVEAHTPSISSIRINDSESTPFIEKLTLEHNLRILSPFNLTSFISLSIFAIKVSLKSTILSVCSAIFSVTSSIALPRPTIPGTFSVPALFLEVHSTNLETTLLLLILSSET